MWAVGYLVVEKYRVSGRCAAGGVIMNIVIFPLILQWKWIRLVAGDCPGKLISLDTISFSLPIKLWSDLFRLQWTHSLA